MTSYGYGNRRRASLYFWCPLCIVSLLVLLLLFRVDALLVLKSGKPAREKRKDMRRRKCKEDKSVKVFVCELFVCVHLHAFCWKACKVTPVDCCDTLTSKWTVHWAKKSAATIKTARVEPDSVWLINRFTRVSDQSPAATSTLLTDRCDEIFKSLWMLLLCYFFETTLLLLWERNYRSRKQNLTLTGIV